MVRSAVAAPLEGAYAVVVPGPARIRNFGDLLRLSPTAVQQFHPKPVVGDDVPAAVAGTFRSGDLFRHLESVAPGDLTICACSLPGNLMDRAVLQRLEANADQLAVTCTRIAPRDRVVVVDVPPQKRLD